MIETIHIGGVIMEDRLKTIPRTINFIEQHLQEDLNLDVIANFTGYSKYHLNRIFSEAVGCTIHKYVQKRRLTEAAKQLVYTDIPIIEIALEAKYESQQAFTLAFGRLYLKTPQLYRENGVFLPKQVIYVPGSHDQRVYANTLYYINNYNKKEMKAAWV